METWLPPLFYLTDSYTYCNASLVAQMVKNLPAMQETWAGSLGQEDSLEKGMATHSSVLAWRIPWTGKPGVLQSMGSQRVGHDLATNTFIFTRNRQHCSRCGGQLEPGCRLLSHLSTHQLTGQWHDSSAPLPSYSGMARVPLPFLMRNK